MVIIETNKHKERNNMKNLSLYTIELDTKNHGYIEMLVDVTYFYVKEGEFHHNSISDSDYYGYSEVEWTPVSVDGADENGDPIKINLDDLELNDYEEGEVCNMIIDLKLGEG